MLLPNIVRYRRSRSKTLALECINTYTHTALKGLTHYGEVPSSALDVPLPLKGSGLIQFQVN